VIFYKIFFPDNNAIERVLDCMMSFLRYGPSSILENKFTRKNGHCFYGRMFYLYIDILFKNNYFIIVYY
jgi:hypothetical protein